MAPRFKTWFIIKKLLTVEESSDAVPPAASGDGAVPAPAPAVLANQVTVKVENAVVDGGLAVKDQAENKGLSAVQLLGKRDHLMTSTEDVNGELSAASGTAAPRAVTARDDFDTQLVECMSDESAAHDYLYNPKINRLTLSFTKPYLEAEYRRDYTSASATPELTQPTLALPRYSGLCDVFVSFFFLLLVVVCCFIGFSVNAPWVVVCLVAVALETAVLLPMMFNVCVTRPLAIVRVVSGWYVRHLCGVVVTSLPSVAAYSAIACAMFVSLPGSDQFYCLLVVTSLLHYCNFTMLSSWMKSVLATAAGIVILILVIVGCCPHEQFVPPLEQLNSSNTSGDVVVPLIFSGHHPLRYEIGLDVVLLLILIWFLNREIEISYRLCYHGDVEAVSDRKQIQAEKEQADTLLRNILPEHVADILKRHKGYSETSENVGVIFAKISNFDDFYDEAYEGGREFLRVLNELMGDFEELFDSPKYKDVEKIKTIGSCLMAAAGLNKDIRDRNVDPKAHLYALMDFSVDLLKKLDQFNRDMLSFKFEMEIGFNFGEVTAGVVGTTKLHYDIWGDAVNVASRMYSTGVHGRIQVTESTANFLDDKFEFEHRGTVFVKGKGDMNTYLLVRKQPGVAWN